MASTLKHLRSSTADKRPTASGLADGQFAINTASGTPGVFFKDSNGGVVKVGPAYVGSSAPNAVPAGSAGNSLGELWVDNSLTTAGLKYYTGSTFVNLTPSGTETTVGLVELATPAETQAGTDAIRAVTPSGLQSKVSDSTSTTSSTTIASSTAVKAAYDLANAALPKAGGTITGDLLIGTTGNLVFEGSSDDSFQTTMAVVNPTADRTITFPNVTGTVITTGDTGTITSTMILDGTITGTDVASGTITSTNIADSTIVNADISASAAIAGTKISPDFGSQNILTTGTITGGSFIPTSSGVPTNGLYLPAANTVGISTNGSNRLQITSTGLVGIGTSSPTENLTIYGTSSRFAVTGGAGSSAILIGNQNGSGANNPSVIEAANGSLYFGGGNSWSGGGTFDYTMTLTNDNKVGIGTASPSTRLHVYQTGSTQAGLVETDQSASVINFKSTSQASGQPQIGCAGSDLILNTNGSERARLTLSGQLLVGTSTDLTNYSVQLANTSGNNLSLMSFSSNAADGVYLTLNHSKSGTVGTQTLVANNDLLGTIRFRGSDGTGFLNGAAISAEVDGTPGANDMPGRLVFSTTADGASSPTERMRISSTGTHDLYGLNDTIYSRTNRGAGTTYVTFAGVHSATGTGTGTASCYIYSNGNIQNTNGSYTTLSDVKLKENIVDAGSQWDDLKAIQIRNWNFKAETGHETHRQIGPIAQELETVCPGLVFETPDRDADGNETGEVTKGVNQSVLYMKAVKALQEAMERIETLEAKVAALEAA